MGFLHNFFHYKEEIDGQREPTSALIPARAGARPPGYVEPGLKKPIYTSSGVFMRPFTYYVINKGGGGSRL